MSILFYLIKSWIIGIAIAAPVGPIGTLCIRKTLELGFVGAIAVGFGAALADAVYGVIAATGLTIISEFLLAKAVFIKLFGGVFLLYLAWKEAKSNPSKTIISNSSKEFIKLSSTVFFLTLTNPMTILSFIGIFASIGGDNITATESIIMVAGIFLGSMSWWMILGTIITKAKAYLNLEWIKYLSATILACFGIFSIGSTLI